jgi:large subunit ribosomal protein L5
MTRLEQAQEGGHGLTMSSPGATLKKLPVLLREQVVPELVKLRGYKNKHEVPKLVKIVLNTGIDAEADKNQIADVQRDLALIAGQKPVLARPARPSRTSS